MQNIFIISKIAFKESLRDKIFIGLLMFLGLIFIFSVYISSLSLGTPARFIENTGMLGISIICLAVVILFGLFSLYREKDRNELYVILNRVSRQTYLLGRLLGTAYIIVIFSFFAGLGIFLLTWFFGGQFAPELFWAVYWAILEFTLLTGVGFFIYSMGVNFTLNSLIVICIFVMGHSMNEAVQSFIGLGQFGNKIHLALVKAVTYIFPNFDMFDFRLAIIHSEIIPAGRILLSSVYWLFYMAALIAASAVILNKRDI
ncbi:ABC transporter permease [Candidatus Magnetomoraceae bacterium gMMP-1]